MTIPFFAEIPSAITELFNGQAQWPDWQNVWEPLRRLSDYLHSTTQSNIEAIFETGRPLPHAMVLLPHGQWLSEAGLKQAGFCLGWSSKGRPVLKNEANETVLNASILCAGAIFADERIQIGHGVTVEPCAFLKGPIILEDHVEIRHGAYLRGNCFIGPESVVGHDTEVKNAIFMRGAKAGHFAYIGDSILGGNVNLGAGTKLANFRFTSGTVRIRINKNIVDTGLKKMGAVLADAVQTGCNTVCNPGTIIGPQSVVYPNTTAGPGLYEARIKIC
jgi:NDP-sugar pyrophosphorylase family protein